MKKLNKKLITLAVASACTMGMASTTAIANGFDFGANKPAQKQDETRYIVTFKEDTSKASNLTAQARQMARNDVLRAHGAQMKLNLDSINAAAVKLTKKQLKALSQDDRVAFVEVDPIRHLITNVNRDFDGAMREVTPQAENNPYGVALVQADQVSDANTGNRMVCIMDTGYEGDHEDLVPNTSPLITGDNNDGLGNNTGNWWQPGHPHGTHVAGTIAALGGNGKGVTSVNPSGLLKVHNVKVFGNSGSWGYGSDLVRAIEQCDAAGANITSMSLGGSASSQAEANAFAATSGILHIAAAGNDGNSSMSYPASYDEVMSVGALNSSKNIASFSQYNSQVEIAAPGVSVRSTVLNNGYSNYDGTSMATPHVSAVAALVWSHYTSCNAAQIRAAINNTAEDLGSAGRDNYYGYGLVQAKDMYDELANGCGTTPPPPPPPPVAGVLENGVPQSGLSDSTGGEQNWTFDVPAGATDMSVSISGGSGDADLYTRLGAAPTTSSYDCRPYAAGNNETCTLTSTGSHEVMIRAYSSYSGVTLTGSYTDGSGGGGGGDSYTNGNNVNIVDNTTVTSSINVTGSGDAGSITVDVDIKHTYIGDISIVLVAPSGATATLRTRSGGSADDIVETYTVNAAGQDKNGTWTLRVTDSAYLDTGYIDSWSINF